MTRGERQVHRRGFAVRIDLGLVEVGVAVDEEQPEAAAPPERESGPEQNRAVAAEDDRELAGVEHALDCVRKHRRPVGDRLRVQRPRDRVTLGAVARRLDAPGVPRIQPVGQTVLQQARRETLDARRLQSEN
jgi:hypothetical protein